MPMSDLINSTGRTTTRLDAVVLSVLAVALGLLGVVEGALIVIGVIDVGGAGEVFGRVLGIFWFAWGIAILGGVIAEIRSDSPWARDDSDRSGTTSWERGIELGDCDDGID